MRTTRAVSLLTLTVTLFAPVAAFAQWAPNGISVSALNDNQHTPVAVTDDAGGAFLAWFDSRGPYGRQIYAQRLDASGDTKWTTNGIPIRDQSGTNWNLGAIADGQGGAIFAWYTAPEANDHIFVQRLDASGNAQWTFGGKAVCDTACNQVDPVIASDGAGGAIIAWLDRRASYDGDVYVQRISAEGERLWDPMGVPICRAPRDQINFVIVADGEGGAIVAWEDYRNGSLYKLYAQRVDGTGAVQWTIDGVPVCGEAGDQYDAAIVSDGSGGAVLAWTDGRAAIYSIRAQRLSDGGAVLWDPEGIALGEALGYAQQTCALPDGSGGVFVAWSETIGNRSFVKIQRLDATGALLLDPAGRRLTNASGSETRPVIASDGAGGAIVAWEDSRANFIADIYAQHVTVEGRIKWEAGGRAICTAPNGQIAPAIAPGPAGTAIVGWSDFRNGFNYDLYAGMPDSTNVVSVGWDAPVTGRIHALRPNPTRAATSLEFELVTPQRVSIEVFDIGGRLVRRLADDRAFPAGPQSLTWDGNGEHGVAVPAGIYNIRLRGAGLSAARRVAVVR